MNFSFLMEVCMWNLWFLNYEEEVEETTSEFWGWNAMTSEVDTYGSSFYIFFFYIDLN